VRPTEIAGTGQCAAIGSGKKRRPLQGVLPKGGTLPREVEQMTKRQPVITLQNEGGIGVACNKEPDEIIGRKKGEKELPGGKVNFEKATGGSESRRRKPGKRTQHQLAEKGHPDRRRVKSSSNGAQLKRKRESRGGD